MKETIIVNPSPTAEWHALVVEAKQAAAASLPEEIESYLVFLLMRFANTPEIVTSILATDFLQSLGQLRRERLDTLREVGDKCLLFAGLFPGTARRRRVRISYFVKLGQTAYSSLSENRNSRISDLYADLCEQFVLLMDVLQTMRELNVQSNSIDLLQAEELWADTKSQHALKTLRQSTQGFSLPHSFNNSHKH